MTLSNDTFANGIDFLDHLNVEQNSANLLSESIWGILRGLETFSQLLFESPDENGVGKDTEDAIY